MPAIQEPVHQQGDDQAGGRAGGNFDELATDLEQSDARQKPEHETVKVIAGQPLGSLPVECSNQNTHDDEADDYAGGSEVQIELHHLADSDAGTGSEVDAGKAGDQVAAACGNGFVGPDSARNEGQERVPKRFAAGVVLGLTQLIDCRAHEKVLVQAAVYSLEVFKIRRIEPFEGADSF